jgi:hypothetical protein
MKFELNVIVGVTPALESLLGRLLNGAAAIRGGTDPAPVSDEPHRDEASQVEAGPTPAASVRGKGKGKSNATATTAGAATDASGAQTGAAADPLGLAGGPTATETVGQDDAAAMALLLGETVDDAPSFPVVSKEDVTAVLKACMDKGIAMTTLQQVFVERGGGAKSIGQVDPSLFGAVKAGFDALLAG